MVEDSALQVLKQSTKANSYVKLCVLSHQYSWLLWLRQVRAPVVHVESCFCEILFTISFCFGIHNNLTNAAEASALSLLPFLRSYCLLATGFTVPRRI